MDGGAWVFGKDLITSLVGKLYVSAGHDNVPVGWFGEMVDDTVSDALVGSGDDDVSDLVHGNSDRYWLNFNLWKDISQIYNKVDQKIYL